MTTTRSCPSCGAQVVASERFCANCGSRMPDMATPAGGQPAIEPTIMLPPPSIPGQTPTPLLPPSSTPPQGQGPMRLSTDTPPSPTPRRGLPLWAILLLGLAGLCVVGCVAAFALVGFVGQQAASGIGTAVVELATAVVTPEEATPEEESGLIVPTPEEESGLIVPTREDLPTRPPETTIEAAPTTEVAPTTGAGGGVVGGVAGTGGAGQVQTAVAATAQVVAATAESEQLFSGAREIFKEEFVDNRNAWFTGVFEEIETDTIEDGVFKVSWSGADSSYELYEVRDLTNFIAEVDCLVVAGGTDGSCGLVFGQKTEVGFYKFELFEDYYRLFVVQAEGDPPVLAEGNPEGIVRPGEVNRLRVVKQGERIRLYVNGVQLADVSDSTFPTGKVGITTNSYLEAGGVEVHFDNFIIWELQ